jgi:dienelactone hydrolase
MGPVHNVSKKSSSRSWLCIVCLVASLLLTCSNASAEEQEFRVLSPSANGPYPAVLLVPGCSGFAATNGANFYEERAAELQAAGYAVVFVDYIVKHMQTNCAHVNQAEIAQDVLYAAIWTRRQPGIDGSRISVIGWSFGAGGVLFALKTAPADPAIAKAVMYYPVCRGAGPWSASVVGLMLIGDKDDVAYPTLCKPLVDSMSADRLRVLTYPDARHGFDNRGFPDHADQSGSSVYDREAAKASWAAVLEFLKQ